VSGEGRRSWVGHPLVGAACRLLLGAIFIYASFPKLLRPGDFARLVYGYQIVHPDLVNLVGITMPWVELAAGAFLVVGILPRSSAGIAAGLLGLFIAAGFLALVRGLEIECGCFFPFMGGHELGWDLLVRDGVLMLPAVQVMVWPSSFIPRGRAAE
jgi:putative oxidoreductase